MTTSHPEANYPCDCGWLDRAADEPASPVKLNPRTNEYVLAGDTDKETHGILYYCPLCGGRAPDSRRQRLFARITHAEARRLREITRDIRTIDDAIRALGEPDSDLPHGMTSQTADSETEPSEIRSFRTIMYSNLSETAFVHITDRGKDRVDIRFMSKPTEDVSGDGIAEAPVRAKDSPALKDKRAGRETVYCSFCNQSEHGVERMLTSTAAAICNECAELFLQGSGH